MGVLRRQAAPYPRTGGACSSPGPAPKLDGYEVDFYSGESGLVQAAWSLDDAAARNRELRALDQAMEELALRESLLISADRAETIAVPSGTVRVLPAWEWLLDG